MPSPNILFIFALSALISLTEGKTLSNLQSKRRKLERRGAVLSYTTTYGSFACSRDEITKSPYQDCLNLIGVFCQNTNSNNAFKGWNDCHSKINAVRDQLNINWKNWIGNCAKWLPGGDPLSAKCKDATSNIRNNEVLYGTDDQNPSKPVQVPQVVTNAINSIWFT